MSTVTRRPAASHLIALASTTALVILATAPAAVAGPVVAQATSQSINLQLPPLGAGVAASNGPTTSINNGSSSPTSVVHANAPAVSLLSGITGLTAGALSEYTEADSDGASGTGNGTSYACAGVVQPGGTVTLGAQKKSCTDTGSGGGGLSLNLGTLTGNIALDAVNVTLDSVTAFATEAPEPGDTAESDSGTGSVTGGDLSILGITVPLSIPAAVNSNLVTTIVDGLTSFLNANPLDTVLDPILNALSSDLAPVVSLCTNYQPSRALHGCAAPAVPVTPTGAFEVSGLHISLLGNGAAYADIAAVTVGPNSLAAAGPAFPREGLPITGAAALVAAAIIVPWYRRRRRALQPMS